MSYRKITAAEARKIFDYDPETGILRRKVKTHGRHKMVYDGTGQPSCKYELVSLYGKCVTVHRLIWLLYYGTWPKQTIDHINGDPRDNRLCNLRDVKNTVNNSNRLRPYGDSKSRILGVYYCNERNKYVARIRVNGRKIHLGSYRLSIQASRAYVRAVKKYRPDIVKELRYNSPWKRAHYDRRRGVDESPK